MVDRRRLLGALAVVWLVASASAQIRMSTKKALQLAFPQCDVQRQTVTLGDARKRAIRKLCDQEFKKGVVFPYVARKAGKLVGTAWFDVHKVRSKRQLLMVVVDPQQRVQRVEVLAFAEPQRYAAPRLWLRKLPGKQLGGVRPGRDVPRITGATLTVRATTRCVERVLALHRVVFGAPPASSGAAKTKQKAEPTTKKAEPKKQAEPTKKAGPTTRPKGNGRKHDG